MKKAETFFKKLNLTFFEKRKVDHLPVTNQNGIFPRFAQGGC